MARQVVPLTDAKIRSAKPKEKDYKLSDGGGLYLLVKVNGSRLWYLKYRIGGKEKKLAIGPYKNVPLVMAREIRDEAKDDIRGGVDPGQKKQTQKLIQVESAETTFEMVAREWHGVVASGLSESHAHRQLRRLENYVFPWIGKRQIADITPREALSVLRKIEDSGVGKTAYRVKVILGQIFRYAIVTDRCEWDPTVHLKGALKPIDGESHHAAITEPEDLAVLLRAIDAYAKGRASAQSRYGIRLAPLVFLRPGELRCGEWSEINWEERQWEIPGHRMKIKNQDHVIPLSHQALAILEELRGFTGGGKYLFPSVKSVLQPISEQTLNMALRSMGYGSDVHTPHGFRATARTLLDEKLGFRPDIIEHQLAHAVKDPNGRAYNRTKFLKQREKMMQRWADYLDELKNN